MTNSSSSHPAYPPALEEALGWLNVPGQEDPLRDLVPLRGHLLALAELDLPPLQLLKIVELFQPRVTRTGRTVRSLLLDATLPLPNRLRAIAQAIIDVHGVIAAAYLRIIRTAPPEKLRALHRAPAELCARGLANLEQQFEIAQLVSAPPPTGLWALAHTLYGLIHTGLPLDGTLPYETVQAENSMKAMLALAAAQPESFAAREVSFLAEYLHRQAASVRIEPDPAMPSDEEYWLDGGRHLAPMAMARKSPPTRATVLRFSCGPLGHQAREHLDLLAAGERPEKMEIPAEAISPDYRNVLARAVDHWTAPPKRQTNRRRQGQRVKVCTHLAQLWGLLRGDRAAASEVELPASEWMILNESPNGYAIVHVAGLLAGLVPGCAIGLQADPGEPWHICVVRWARSEHLEHIELGLELMAPQATAVRIARQVAAGEQPRPLPALLLPPLPALKRSETLMTARGDFAPGPFALLQEFGPRVQVTECSARQLAMHTASIEIFEFERQAAAG